MELVVSTAIIGTLAAFAVPSYIEAGNKAKGAKSLDNINTIGAGILNAYSRVAGEGTSDGNAIAKFNAAIVSPLDDNDGIIIYYDGIGDVTIKMGVDGIDNYGNLIPAIFPNGVPESPFGGKYLITVDAAGIATWGLSGGVITLNVTQTPQLTITDPVHTNISASFSP